MPYVNGKYINYSFTKEECKKMVDICKQAIVDLMSGQAQEYTIGSRSVKFISIKQAQEMQDYFAGEIRKYEVGSRPARSVAVVFRDT